MATYYLRPSADVDLQHNCSTGSSGYALINEATADDDNRYIVQTFEGGTSTTSETITSKFIISGEIPLNQRLDSATLYFRARFNNTSDANSASASASIGSTSTGTKNLTTSYQNFSVSLPLTELIIEGTNVYAELSLASTVSADKNEEGQARITQAYVQISTTQVSAYTLNVSYSGPGTAEAKYGSSVRAGDTAVVLVNPVIGGKVQSITDNGSTVTSKITETATDARQMLALRTYVMNDPAIPGNINVDGVAGRDVNYTTVPVEGFTCFLVELKDGATTFPTTVETFEQNVKSVQLISNTTECDDSYIISFSGTFDKFYFAAKGKARNRLYNEWERLSATGNAENLDGTTDDGVSDEDLPYDMKAEIIEIADEHVGTFYMDALDHPERYDGKNVRVVGQPFQDHGLPAGYYLFGREAMTCCANDIAKIGWVCQGTLKPTMKSFFTLTAKCRKVTQGDQAMIMMEEMHVEKAAAPKEEYVTFS